MPDFRSILERLESEERSTQLQAFNELDYAAHVLAHRAIFEGEDLSGLMQTLDRIAGRSLELAETDASLAPLALHSLRHMPYPPVQKQMKRITAFLQSDQNDILDATLELMVRHGAFVPIIQELQKTPADSSTQAPLYSAAYAMLQNRREYHSGPAPFMPYSWQQAVQKMQPDLAGQCRQLPRGEDRKNTVAFSQFLSGLPPALAISRSLFTCLHMRAEISADSVEKQNIYFAISALSPDRISVRRLAELVRKNRSEFERAHLINPLASIDARWIAREYYLAGFEQDEDARLKIESALALRILGRAVASLEGKVYSTDRVESRSKTDQAFQDELLELTENFQPDRELTLACMEVYRSPPDFEIEVREYLRRNLVNYRGDPIAGLVPLLLEEFEGSFHPRDVLIWNAKLPPTHIEDADLLIKKSDWLPYLLALKSLGPAIRPRLPEIVEEMDVPFPGSEAYEEAASTMRSIGLESPDQIRKYLHYLEKHGESNYSKVRNVAFVLGALSPAVAPGLRDKVVESLWSVAKEGELARLIAADSVYRIDPAQKDKVIQFYLKCLEAYKGPGWRAAPFIARFGKDAKEALPLLRRIEETGPDYATDAARKAIEKIEQDLSSP
ncbi:MAG: hypothetical protein KDK37_12930 [Leptospiraceae bacterium]|nr:hypothetical protein [Leptospiraceae bacterium]